MEKLTTILENNDAFIETFFELIDNVNSWILTNQKYTVEYATPDTRTDDYIYNGNNAVLLYYSEELKKRIIIEEKTFIDDIRTDDSKTNKEKAIEIIKEIEDGQKKADELENKLQTLKEIYKVSKEIIEEYEKNK